jgi:hypothetical protein
MVVQFTSTHFCRSFSWNHSNCRKMWYCSYNSVETLNNRKNNQAIYCLCLSLDSWSTVSCIVLLSHSIAPSGLNRLSTSILFVGSCVRGPQGQVVTEQLKYGEFWVLKTLWFLPTFSYHKPAWSMWSPCTNLRSTCPIQQLRHRKP